MKLEKKNIKFIPKILCGSYIPKNKGNTQTKLELYRFTLKIISLAFQTWDEEEIVS